MKFPTILFSLLLAAAIVSCKTNNTSNDDSSKKNATPSVVLKSDSMVFVRDIPIQMGMKISAIPVETRRGRSNYDYTLGEEKYIFRGPKGRKGGEFYPDQSDTTEVGTIHIVNPCYVSDEGIHPGMTYKELSQIIKGLEIKGSAMSRRMDFIKDNVTFSIDHPVQQLAKNGNNVDALEITRMIYKSPNDKD